VGNFCDCFVLITGTINETTKYNCSIAFSKHAKLNTNVLCYNARIITVLPNFKWSYLYCLTIDVTIETIYVFCKLGNRFNSVQVVTIIPSMGIKINTNTISKLFPNATIIVGDMKKIFNLYNNQSKISCIIGPKITCINNVNATKINLQLNNFPVAFQSSDVFNYYHIEAKIALKNLGY
jgi:hypothetical protein